MTSEVAMLQLFLREFRHNTRATVNVPDKSLTCSKQYRECQ